MDIAIAERRCSDAVQLLKKAEGECAHPQSIDWSDPEHQTRFVAGLVETTASSMISRSVKHKENGKEAGVSLRVPSA